MSGHIDQDRLLSTFLELVSIDSPSLGERAMGDHILRMLTDLGLDVLEDDAGRKLGGTCGNIRAFLPGSVGAPLLFCTHLDTVEPSRGKKAILSEDGIIRSDGTTVLGADDLAGVAAVLEALRVITAGDRPHHPIELLFTVAEELYCRGSEVMDFSILVSREAYVLDLVGPIGDAAYAAPSILSFTADLRGRAAHAGFAPEDGIDAIKTAARALTSLQTGRTGPETTINAGLIQGGEATNIVPECCTVRGEVRSLDHVAAVRQMEQVRDQFKAAADASGTKLDFRIRTESVAYATDQSHPSVSRFKRAALAVGRAPSLLRTFGGSDNNRLAEHGITGLVLAAAMEQCHSCVEYTRIDELACSAELAVALMTDPD